MVLTGALIREIIGCDDNGTILTDNRGYTLSRINLVRAGCPQDLQQRKENQAPGLPIVVEKNRKKWGYVAATDFWPPAVIVAGAARRHALLERGDIHAYAWVENGALEIKADDQIGSNELMGKLNDLLNTKFFGNAKQPGPGQAWPYIKEVYPFEQYTVFNYRGQDYRQHFILDPVERDVKLINGSIAVQQKFVNACGTGPMPRVQTGIHYAYAPVDSPGNRMTQGAKNSELITMIVRDWTNIQEAVSVYLTAVKSGNRKPLRPSFYPVQLSDAGKILGPLVKAGIDPFDFAIWSEEQKKKAVGTGEKVAKKKFAYIGDPKDKSTWKLPIHDPSHARNVLARLNQTQGIPSSAKPRVLQKIRRSAKGKGVEVSDKPTGGQKKWMKGNMGLRHGSQVEDMARTKQGWESLNQGPRV